MLNRSALAAVVLLAVVNVACGQVRPPINRGGMPLPAEGVEAQGTIEAIAPGTIQLFSSFSQQRLMVAIAPQTKVELTGTATADFLAAGMYVRVTAEFDKQGSAKDKVGQVTIFTPSREWPLGIQPGEAGGEAAAGADQQKPKGEKPKGEKPAGAAGGGADRSKRHAKGGSPLPAEGVYVVAGQITGVQNGTVTVAAGNVSCKFEVADDAKIDVRVADYRFARPGDKIGVKGRMLPGKPGYAQAFYVKIEAAAPFSGPAAKPGKSPPKHEPRQSKKAAEK